mgnify:FL=1
MNAELKAMLEKLNTSELDEVLEVVSDLVSIKTEEDDGQPSEEKEQSDFAQDNMVPYEPEY